MDTDGVELTGGRRREARGSGRRLCRLACRAGGSRAEPDVARFVRDQYAEWVGGPAGRRASAIDSRPREGSVSGQLPDQWGRHLRCLDVGHFVLLHICIFRQTTIAHINLPDLTLLSSSHRRDAMQRNGIVASFWAV